MQMRRFTRLTNTFSKKVENYAYHGALHAVHSNSCRIHKSLRVTPAMEAGIADHMWTLDELVELPSRRYNVARGGHGMNKLMGYGIAIGVGIGAAIGAATDDMGKWVAVGVAIGVAIGFGMNRAKRKPN